MTEQLTPGETQPGLRRDAVAIVGMGCRFAGARTVREFWTLLRGGVESVREIPPERFGGWAALYDPRPGTPGRIASRRGGFLEGLDRFDPHPFGLAPREAAFLDPQQRLLLEVAWEALEMAGLPLERVAGRRAGVYVGLWTGDYENCMYGATGRVNLYMVTGAGRHTAAGRLSHVFNLQGPSLMVDSGCSSSLVAVHLACQSLLSGESELALAGGANVILQPPITVAFSGARMLSADGRCKFGDASADGYVRSEGAAVVALKRLSDALRDGDPIQGIILGSAVNHDGQQGLFLTPSQRGQEALLRAACAAAGVAPERLQYVEAHGTGTAAGDPVELQALGAVLGAPGRRAAPLLVGSVKTNIGHTEAAAGVAGLIKAVLALQHRQIPPSLNFNQPNPNIPWRDLPLEIPTLARPWPAGDGAPLAGINSFGVAGTNAHVIVTEGPRRAADSGGAADGARAWLAPLSAHSPEALRALARGWREFLLEEDPGDEPRAALADICYTAAVRRSHHEHRLAIAGRRREELAEKLEAWLEEPPDAAGDERSGAAPGGLAFVFSGQGGQWHVMGRGLMAHEPLYRAFIERCDALLRQHVGWSLLEELEKDEASSLINRTDRTQPALFALQLGLAELLRSWGVRPDAIVGHSSGEVAAACAAGALRLEDGLRIIAHRGRLQQGQAGRGLMAATDLALEEAERLLAPCAGRVGVATINSGRSLTLAGEPEAITELVAELERQGRFARLLRVDIASHSPQMEPCMAELTEAARGIALRAPETPLISTVTGREAAPGDFGPEYWARNIRQPVRFADAMATLIGRGITTFVELGPHPVLAVSIAQCLQERGAQGTALPALRRGEDEPVTLLQALGALYAQGREVNWPAFYPAGGRVVGLPLYPWQRERFWYEDALEEAERPAWGGQPGESGGHPALGRHCEPVEPGGRHCFLGRLDARSAPWLKDHLVQEALVAPAAALCELMLAAADEAFGPGPHALEEVRLHKALIAPARGARAVQVTLDPAEPGMARCRIFSRAESEQPESAQAPGAEEGAEWVCHAEAAIELGCPDEEHAEAPVLMMPPEEREGSVDGAAHLQAMQSRGLAYGPAFQSVERLWLGEGEALGRLRMAVDEAWRAQAAGWSRLGSLTPPLVDGGLQLLVALAAAGERPTDRPGPYLPVRIEQLEFGQGADLEEGLWARATRRAEGAPGQGITGDIVWFDGRGRVALAARGVALARMERTVEDPQSLLHAIEWAPAPQGGDGAPACSPPVLRNAVLSGIAEEDEQRRAEAARLAREVLPEMEAICAAYALEALTHLGWAMPPGERVRSEDLIRRLGVAPRHQKLLGRLLAMLGETGALEPDGAGGWLVRGAPSGAGAERAAARLARLRQRRPECEPELNLLARCGGALAAVLRGEQDPLHLIFPGGSAQEVGRIYEDALFSREANAQVRRVLEAATKDWPAGRPLRVLEIGGGSGGTTAHLLPALAAARARGVAVEYVFTDVGPLFLARAEERFGKEYPFLRARRLDIAQDPAAQGFEPASFDLALAANVLHATPELRRTLAHAKGLLAPGGLLLLLEGTAPRRWIDLTFGLLEGWWLFADHDLRPDYPLLGAERWSRVLSESGFEAPLALPVLEEPAAMLFEQSVILAAAPAPGRAPAGAAPGRWLIFADQGGVGERLAALLRQRGAQDALLVRPGGGELAIDPQSPAQFTKLVSALHAEPSAPLKGVVYLWALDEPALDELEGRDGAALAQSQGRVGAGALHLAQALARLEGPARPRLYLVTRGAQPAGEGAPTGAAQATLWGLGRVAALEHPDLRCTMVDLDPHAAAEESAGRLLAEALQDDCELLVAWRGGERLGARLAPLRPAHGAEGERRLARPAHRPCRLRLAQPGSPDHLTLKAARRRSPGAGELEIRVQAAGLNFRDVWVSLGMLPGDDERMGLECAGTVERLGAGVTGLRPGDAVTAFAPDAFGSYAIADARFTVPTPPGLSPAAAATLPIAFLTAAWGLRHLARLKAGESVLIHAASGGVGLAALQIVKAAGARAFGTAGSERKRQFLRDMGVEQVFDSRSPGFDEKALAATGGRGVDVVLNSLSGEFIPQSLKALAPGGRFIEIGKREIWTPERMRAARPDCAYYPFDLLQVAAQEPELLAAMLRDLADEVGRGELAPLPHRAFALEEAPGAFRHMAAARHIGKVVLVNDEAKSGAGEPLQLREDASYLVTGGLGGLGQVTARWLASRGARRIALAGRSASPEQARELTEELAAQGARALILPADVSRADDVQSLIERVESELGPLAGVVHAAGTLADAALLQQEWGRFEQVLAPKALGSWLLHRATRHRRLDFFVMYSSTAAVLGSPGQANHAAANAFLDALAHWRRARGLPALSINWGPWAEVGAAASGEGVAWLAGLGLGSFSPEQGVAALERLLAGETAQAAVMRLDAARWRASHPLMAQSPYLERLRAEDKKEEAQSPAESAKSAEEDVRAALQAAAPGAARRQVMETHLRRQVARVLRLGESRVSARRPFKSLGLDSLSGLELRNRLEASLGLTLPASLVWNYPTLDDLGPHLAGLMGLPLDGEAPGAAEAAAEDAELASLLSEIEALSEDEARRLAQGGTDA